MHLNLTAADSVSATVFLYIVLFSLSSQTTVLSVDSERRLLALFLLLFYWGNKMTFLFSPFLYLSQCVVVQIFCREFLQSSYWISGCPDQLGVLFVAGRGKMCYFSLPFFLQHFITSYSEFYMVFQQWYCVQYFTSLLDAAYIVVSRYYLEGASFPQTLFCVHSAAIKMPLMSTVDL